MNGYAGQILRLDLTNRKVSTMPTSDYEQWGGGHGMGSAIFFDLVKDKTIDGFDPANVVTLMTSPFCGTLVPAAGGRTEVQGIGVQSYPIGWFTRSNFGGRFSSQLKYAGWDGVVIEGRADKPAWIDIRNGDVQIRDCADLSLWGKDTQKCQEAIWGFVAGSRGYVDWLEPGGGNGGQCHWVARAAAGHLVAGQVAEHVEPCVRHVAGVGGVAGLHTPAPDQAAVEGGEVVHVPDDIVPAAGVVCKPGNSYLHTERSLILKAKKQIRASVGLGETI